MKHAYLILAHEEFELLKLLVSTLDDPRNDIYIHFDAKTSNLPTIKLEHAGLHILNDRIDIRWGDESQIEAEIALLETATKNHSYAYYHLLSGVDLPLKNQDYIHNFFEKNNGKEFIGYAEIAMTPEIIRKVQRWHLFPRNFRNGPTYQRIIRSIFIKVQETFRIRRNNHINFKKGANWVSITDSFARYFLSRKEWIRKTFTHTYCCDEIAMQTICWDSPFREALFDTCDEWKGNMRLIGWKNGCLHDWSAEDFEMLANSEALFARKFNSTDMSFIKRMLYLSK